MDAIVYCYDPDQSPQIKEQMNHFNIQCVDVVPPDTPYLTPHKSGLMLIWDVHRFQINLMNPPYRMVSSRARHLLLEALPKKKDLWIIDATAGLLRDSWLCAQAGHKVWACEKHPLLSALILDNQHRQGDLWPDHLTFFPEDVRSVLENQHPDVVLIDPMFERRKKKTKPDLYLQAIQALNPECSETMELLKLALDRATCRVILKRHKNEPILLPKKLNHQRFSNKSAIRLDLYEN